MLVVSGCPARKTETWTLVLAMSRMRGVPDKTEMHSDILRATHERRENKKGDGILVSNEDQQNPMRMVAETLRRHGRRREALGHAIPLCARHRETCVRCVQSVFAIPLRAACQGTEAGYGDGTCRSTDVQQAMHMLGRHDSRSLAASPPCQFFSALEDHGRRTGHDTASGDAQDAARGRGALQNAVTTGRRL